MNTLEVFLICCFLFCAEIANLALKHDIILLFDLNLRFKLINFSIDDNMCLDQVLNTVVQRHMVCLLERPDLLALDADAAAFRTLDHCLGTCCRKVLFTLLYEDARRASRA